MKQVFSSIILVLVLSFILVSDAKAGKREDNLVYSASNGDVDNVRKLLDQGVDVNAKESLIGCTALVAASQGDHLDVVQLLLARGANPNIPGNVDGIEGYTALIVAAEHGNAEMVRILIGKGADVNMKNEVDYTALSTVNEKLTRGQSTGMDNSNHIMYRPLTTAEKNAYTSIVRMLIAAGAK